MGNAFNAEILAKLGEATAEEIHAALAAIAQDTAPYREQAPTAEVVTALKGLSDAATKLRAELTSRAALADEHAATLAALSDLTAAPEPAAPATEPAPVEPAVQPQTAPAPQPEPVTGDKPEGDKPADAPGDKPSEGDDNVTASGRSPLGITNKPATGVALRTFGAVNYRTTAAVGDPAIQPGTQFNRVSLAAAMRDRIHAVYGTNGFAGPPGRERHTVATIRAQFPEARTLLAGANWDANVEKLEAAGKDARAAAQQNALVAAGLCAPMENIYDIEVIGDTDRPIRDALVRMTTTRGGVQWRPSFDGVTQTGGIGVWTTANDEADPLVAKTCVEIDCPGLTDAEIEAIYMCLTFSNMSTRFDPEHYDAVIRAQAIAAARFGENRLYSQMLAGSKAIVAPPVLLGATRDILVTFDKMLAYSRNVHRYNGDQPMRWIAPRWALDLMRADMTRQMVGDGMQALSMTDAALTQFFTDRNVNPTFHLDGIDPADIVALDPDVVVPAQFYTLLAANSLVPGFPDAISSLLFREGDWYHLDGGTLDLGVVRDSTLNGLNRFQTFSEEFGMPFFRGIESIHLVIPVQPRGGSAATVSTASAVD